MCVCVCVCACVCVMGIYFGVYHFYSADITRVPTNNTWRRVCVYGFQAWLKGHLTASLITDTCQLSKMSPRLLNR